MNLNIVHAMIRYLDNENGEFVSFSSLGDSREIINIQRSTKQVVSFLGRRDGRIETYVTAIRLQDSVWQVYGAQGKTWRSLGQSYQELFNHLFEARL